MNKTTFEQLKGELYNKIRTVKDISRYVDKKEDLSANYSVFLGAGASVTSNISSGGNLVEEWRKEIFLSECKDINHTEILSIVDEEERRNRIIHELIKLRGGWYNPQNEYSSLFEKKFDLPSQRRKFVESLVDDKLPSIGYLYLISLINKKYFNTVFTTNFDDLINEAFYHFSNTRPYVCAHDSSIGSLSILSKRPQIVKLHGDYLFDDIKNTLKETESLEVNTREKFIEFSKDSGLIIVGYSGQDRSIMDVLNYLVQQEEYLKNGIYWCFRKGDEISQDLRKLLWRDKVYCVEIDGFDQFFAELSAHLSCPISIKDENVDSKRGNTIKQILKDSYNLRLNPIIDKDIEELEDDNCRKDISNFMAEMYENKNKNISLKDFRDLYEIESLLHEKKYGKVLSIIDLKEKNWDGDYDYKILRLKVLKLAKMNAEALNLIEDLLKGDSYNVKYCFFRADFFEKDEDKIDYLLKCNSEIEYSVELKNKILYEFISYYDIHGKEYIDVDKLISIADESISIEPSLDNDAFSFLFSVLKIKSLRLRLKPEDKQKIYSEMESLIYKISKINKMHSNYFNIKSRYCLLNPSIDAALGFYDEIISCMDKVSVAKRKFLYSRLSDDLLGYSISDKFYNEMKKAKANNVNLYNRHLKFNEIINDFFEIDLTFKKDVIKFMVNKAKYTVSKKRDIGLAIDICKEALKTKGHLDFIRSIVEIITFNNTNLEMVEFIKDYIVENKGKIDDMDYKLSMLDIYECLGDKVESYKLLETFSDESKDDYTYIMKKIYNYIFCEKYDEALSFYRKSSETLKKFSQSEKDIISLNFYLAKKKLGILDNEDKNNIRSIVSRSSQERDILIGCNNLLDNEQAVSLMKEQIDIDFRNYYCYIQWPIVNESYKKNLSNYVSDRSTINSLAS
ncbi:SIR2 family protein [Acinetobacter tandoii]|uniref:SIR2 family protein n=1 Tax=Acinetobacter tandoii TaxID=202954 RepID=UPI003015D4C4